MRKIVNSKVNSSNRCTGTQEDNTMGNTRDHRVLAGGITISNDTHKTFLNNNDTVVGGTGVGKTSLYMAPNIENAMNESIVVADTKGNLCKRYREMLEQRGYRVLNIDFKNIRNSEAGFNPIAYIRRMRDGHYLDQDIIKLGSLLCPCNPDSNQDPFWDYSAQNYINCAIACMLETAKRSDRNMATLFEYAGKICSQGFAMLIESLRSDKRKRAESYALKCYRQVEETRESEKTMSSILSVMRSHLTVFDSADALKLFMHENQLRFERLGDEKTALFLTISDSDRSMDRLVNLMYTNMFDALIRHADSQPGERLKVPVHFYMDDFATNTTIPEFDNLISVIRSREISVSIIIQGIEQLTKSYPKGASTILANCDHIVFLGAADPVTADYISTRIGKMRTTVMNLPRDKAYLIEAGKKPRQVDKYPAREV